MLERASQESKLAPEPTATPGSYTQIADLLSVVTSYFSAPKYDKQIILSLLNDSTTTHCLKKKAIQNGLEVHTLNWLSDDLDALRLLTPHSRIYIEGHYGPGLPALHSKTRFDKNDVSKTSDDLVNLLLQSAPQLRTLTSTHKRIKICILGCNTAVDRFDGSESYCKRLSKQLEAQGIYATVHGYNGSFRMGHDNKDKDFKICKLIRGEHQPSGYKSIFTKGHEVIYEPSLLTSIKQFF